MPTKEYQNFVKNYQPRIIDFIPIPVWDTSIPEEREEVVSANPLEPQTLKEFVGQEKAKEILRIIVDSANKEKRLIPNILLTGAYGHGKTTLAKLIAKRHKKKLKIIDGSIAGSVIKPDPGKIYIVDEAHNIPAKITDSFNIMIDAGELRIVACTTNPGALPAPFRSRFRTIYLTEYQPLDIAKIIQRATNRLEVKIDKTAVDMIANRSKCNPRAALTILDFVREIGSLNSNPEITIIVVLDALNKLGINEIGLTILDRKYLELLRTDRPVGLQYISSVLSVDSETIQEEIEPYLIRLGIIERTARGRVMVDPAAADREIKIQETLKKIIEGKFFDQI